MSPVEQSKIGWTTSTWNPVTGCTQISPGCANCYAKGITERFGGDFSQVILHHDRMDQPLHWKKPRRIFVNSMSDLFHKDIPDSFLWAVFHVMAQTPQHIYQVLTKRPERMQAWVESRLEENRGSARFWSYIEGKDYRTAWPLENVWLGVSVENQHFADERIPLLLDTPAAVHWVSYEPALEAVDFEPFIHWQRGEHVQWLVCGGESGSNRRPFNVAWAESAYMQCKDAGVPFFMKQDAAFKSEQQGRIPDWLWNIKEYPQP